MCKQKLTHDEFMDMSTDRAEEAHHQHCEYACCGEHDGVFTDEVKECPVCGMTPEIQQQHNEDWWAGVDEVEGDILSEYEVEGYDD